MNVSVCSREEIRASAVEIATGMIVQECGLSIRMDDVARALAVSKRTLYEIFGSKEVLLEECMNKHFQYMTDCVEEEMRRGDDVLSVFLRHLEMFVRESKNGLIAVRYADLEKYPRLVKLFAEHQQDMSVRMRRFMEMGVEQGVFRDDLNMDVLMAAFSVMGKMANEEKKRGTFPYNELIDGTMVILLRGIATVDGMKQLDMYRSKSMINDEKRIN